MGRIVCLHNVIEFIFIFTSFPSFLSFFLSFFFPGGPIEDGVGTRLVGHSRTAYCCPYNTVTNKIERRRPRLFLYVSFSSRLQWMTDRELIKHARTKWLYKPRMYTAMVGGLALFILGPAAELLAELKYQ
jgi:hypothetical protein